MKFLKFILVISFFICFQVKSQEFITGKVVSEFGSNLQNVTVINLSNEIKTFTDNEGNFTILASVSDELRFIKPHYERVSMKISSSDFKKFHQITLTKIPDEIQEVEIKYLATGNLAEDNKHFGDSKKVAAVKNELSEYILKKSDLSVLKPRIGEFVQPVGKGISIGAIHDKWSKVDFYKAIISNLGKDYFAKINISDLEVFTFLDFALKDFNSKNILKYGYFSTVELAKIQVLIDENYSLYKMLKKTK